MKDIIITAKRIKIEIITFLICFVIGFFVNIGAIISFKSEFIEILTSLKYVLVFSIVLYAFWTAIRIVFIFVKKLIKK